MPTDNHHTPDAVSAFRQLVCDLQKAWGDHGGKWQVGHQDLVVLENALAILFAARTPTASGYAHISLREISHAESTGDLSSQMAGILRQRGLDDLAPSAAPVWMPIETAPIVSIKRMPLSDGRTDYFVSIRRGDREVTPHMFREEYKAAYHVALYSWLLLGTPKPDLMAFNPDDFPATARPSESPAPFPDQSSSVKDEAK